MQRRNAIRLETYIPLVRKAKEPPALEIWTWWHFAVARLGDSLPGSQEPLMIRTEWYLWVIWTVADDELLNVLMDFFEESRRRFGLDQLQVHHYPVTSNLFE